MAGFGRLLNLLNVIRQVPIFAKLNWYDLQRIARKSTLHDYRKGEIIAREGNPPDNFYCLISGRLQAYTEDAQGKRDNIEFIHRGMHFGIISLLTGENHTLTFEALNDSLVLQISKEDFQEIYKSVPHLGLEFSESLSKRMRHKVVGSKSVFESTIISVYSPVEGTGASTYAVNLALNIGKETKKNVVFLNINTGRELTGEVKRSNWRKPPVNLCDVADDPQKVKEQILKGDRNVDLVNVYLDLNDLDNKKLISPLVSQLAHQYHFVVIDLPHDMDPFVVEALTQSDMVHLISMDREEDLKCLHGVIDKLEQDLQEGFKPDNIRVLIRPFDHKVYLSFEEIDKAIEYNVYSLLPSVRKESFREEIYAGTLFYLTTEKQTPYELTLSRISREIGRVLVGLVLGGGAALGIAHVGVIRVLEEEKIPVDIVVGSSMGALIGSLWTTGLDKDKLEAAAREFERKRDILKLFDPFIIPIAGLVGDRSIVKWLKKHLGQKTFYGTRIPFKAVAYDLVRREEMVIQSGSLVEAVRKSISIPGVLEPVLEDERVLIDGGVLNPLPTNVLARLGIKKIIAVNVLQSPEFVNEGFEIEQAQLKQRAKVPFLKKPGTSLAFRFSRFFAKIFSPNVPDIIVRTLQASEYVIAEESAKQADVLIQPKLIGINWNELHRVDDLVRLGEEATRELLPEIRKLIRDGG